MFGEFLPAEATRAVNAGGGQGVHFAALPAAVQAASDGDTIGVKIAFRLVGFSRANNGALNLRITNCAGMVHLERMRIREYGWFFPTWLSVEIFNSANVTMRQFDTFGSPCGQCSLVVAACRLTRQWIVPAVACRVLSRARCCQR
ncbi:MAG: hypothetical protein ACI89X_001471 [Planctomycetota bacterium]|jgi:hypothetical protein